MPIVWCRSTLQVSRFGSGPCIRRPTAVVAGAIAPGTRSCRTRTPSTFFFLVWEKGGFVRTLRTPLATCLPLHVEALLLVLAPLRTKAVLTVLHRNDPPWPHLDCCSQPTRFPEALAYTGLRALYLALQRSCLHVESWMNVAAACDETRPGSISVLARSERACRWFWNEIWNF